MAGIGVPSIRLKALRLPPSSRIATFSLTPISLAFATAASTIFCASSEEMLCFVTTFAIGHLPSLDGYCALIHISKEWGDHAVVHETHIPAESHRRKDRSRFLVDPTCGQALVP